MGRGVTYWKFRGGVDRRNSYVVHYRAKFSSQKWWVSVFERLFETSLLNAFIIYKCLHPENYLHRKGVIRVEFHVCFKGVLGFPHKLDAPYVQEVPVLLARHRVRAGDSPQAIEGLDAHVLGRWGSGGVQFMQEIDEEFVEEVVINF
jgi:hypothetical protein